MPFPFAFASLNAFQAVRHSHTDNNQLAMGVANASNGWQESIDYHTVTTMGNDMSVQWMTEQGGEKKIRPSASEWLRSEGG
jgi:hypothetical protein